MLCYGIMLAHSYYCTLLDWLLMLLSIRLLRGTGNDELLQALRAGLYAL